MSLRSIGAVAVFAAAAWCAAPAAWAQDPTIHQVYQAAEAGKFIEAQAMMDKVLADHPKSGKAHYIQAELLAKQGKFAQAGTELATAERLAPGLPFAKPEAVQQLRALAARAHKAPATATPAAAIPKAAPDLSYERQVPAAPERSGLPWGIILAVGAVILFAISWFRKKAGNQAVQQRYAGTPGPAGTPGAGYPQYANPGNAPFGSGMGAPPGAGPGIGSGIMGGLATGAALGAGMVAGQALMHRFTDGDGNHHGSTGNNLAPGADPLGTPDPLFDTPPLNDDMGGSDFGISDAGSWDDGGSGGGGGDEWN